MQNVVYSFTTYSPRNGQGVDQEYSSQDGSSDDLPVIQSRYWRLERDESYQTFLNRMKRNHSPFLLPPTVVKEGEFRNVANMTASTVQRSKGGQANYQQQHAQQPVLTPGHTLIIEGVQIELNLNPGSGSGGISGEAEWVIRMGWIGGAPNPLNVGNQPLATKGIIVEVSHSSALSLSIESSCHLVPCMSGRICTAKSYASRNKHTKSTRHPRPSLDIPFVLVTATNGHAGAASNRPYRRATRMGCHWRRCHDIAMPYIT